MKSLLVLTSKEDARKFLKNKFTVNEIISINPTAEAELGTSNVELSNSLQVYDDQAHLVTARHIQDGIKEVEKRLRERAFDPITINRIRALTFYMIAAGSFFAKITKGYDNISFYNGKRFVNFSNHTEAYNALLKITLDKYRLDKDFKPRSAIHNLILKNHNNFVLEKLIGQKKVFLTDGQRPSINSFKKELESLNKGFKFINAKQPGKNLRASLKYSRRSKKKLQIGETPDFFCYVDNMPSHKSVMQAASEDSFRQSIYDAFSGFIDSNINLAESFAQKTSVQMQELAPEMIISDAINSAFNEAACKQVKEKGGKVVLFNHATNSPQHLEPIKALNDLWAKQGVLFSEYATHNALRSKHMAELVENVFGEASKDKLFPICYSEPVKKIPHEDFNIVYAGNYLPVKDHIPLLAETPDEFAKTILDIAKVVSLIPKANLVIKLKKRKKECNDIAIEKLMPNYANVKIKSTDSFASELPECDLVVSNLSTTIDEAIESGTPVLLYSANGRYQHLQGKSEMPTEQGRAAIYTPEPDSNLKEFILAIIKAHKNKPLREEEYESYLWSKADSMKSFVGKVVGSV